MTVYTTIPQDDSNLDITITEAPDLVTLDLNSASFNLIGAVNSVNGLQGDVTLELGLPEAEVQTLIDDAISAIDYPVDSVNGQTGDVVLTTNEISEDVNLYYTDARVDDYLKSGNITSIAFSNGTPGVTTLSWNVDDGTLEFPLNPDVTLQIGQENVILARNESGSTLPDGTAVRVTGAQGARLTIDRADNANDALSASTIAVTTQTIANNNPGYITTEGLVRGLNTSMWAEGATLYLGSNGALTTTKPLTPLHMVPMGWVVRSHATEGSIFVKVINGQELDELHDVLITSPVAGQGIVWDGVKWVNQNITVDLTGYATEAYVDAAIPTLTSELTNDSGFITGYTESDPVYSASVAAGITTQNIIDWTTAFNWGDHALAGYLTAETDSQTLSFSNPNLSISNGNTVDLSGLTPDLTGYATEAYVDAAVFSGDYNDLINQPAIPADVGDLTDVGGLLLTAEDLYKNEDITLHVNNGTRAHWTYRTTYDAPNDIYNSDLIMQSFGVSTAGIFNLVRYKTAGDNIFLRYSVEDTGNGDDGSHRTVMELQGSENIITATNSLYVNSDNISIESGNLTISTPNNLNTVAPQHTYINDGGSSTFISSKNELDAYIDIDMSGLTTYINSMTDSTEAMNIPLRIIRRHSDEISYADDTQMVIQFGSHDGTDFRQLGQVGGRFDSIDGHETKLQTMNPADNSLLNNWTVHEHYIYGGKPIRQTYYNDTDRDALSVVQDGMLIWNTDANALQVYHTGAWNAVGGGGGASALGDLTDVEIGGVGNPLTDGDLLRYNGISGTWQNTNLGITLAPVLSTINTVYTDLMAGFEITNWSDYGQPSWEVFLVNPDTSETPLTVVTSKPGTAASVYKSSMVGKAMIAYDAGTSAGYLHILVPNVSGNYKIKIRAQDFGDLPSEYTLHDFTVNDITFTGGSFNYIRMTTTRESKTAADLGGPYFTNDIIPSSAYWMLTEMTFWSSAGGTGSESPSIAMTSNSTSSYTASASSVFANSGSYQPWRAFDNATSGNPYWSGNSTATTGTDWIQLSYLTTPMAVNSVSMCFTNMSYIPWGFKLEGSNTGAFAGEQSLILELDGFIPNGSSLTLIAG